MKKRFLCGYLLIALLLCWSGSALALPAEFVTEPIGETGLPESLELEPLGQEPHRRPVRCFDVREDGVIALGWEEDFNYNVICLYDGSGTFLGGYRFVNGGSFGILWDGNDLLLCMSRGNAVLSIREDGTAVPTARIQNNRQTMSIWNRTFYAPARTVNGTRYTLSKNLGPFGLLGRTYTRLTVTEPDGTERRIYDVNAETLQERITILLLGMVLALAVSYGLYDRRKQRREEAKGRTGQNGPDRPV